MEGIVKRQLSHCGWEKHLGDLLTRMMEWLASNVLPQSGNSEALIDILATKLQVVQYHHGYIHKLEHPTNVAFLNAETITSLDRWGAPVFIDIIPYPLKTMMRQ